MRPSTEDLLCHASVLIPDGDTVSQLIPASINLTSVNNTDVYNTDNVTNDVNNLASDIATNLVGRCRLDR